MVSCQPDNAIAQQEVFGPVLSVISFETDDEAVAIANATDYGLVAGVFTQDLTGQTVKLQKPTRRTGLC